MKETFSSSARSAILFQKWFVDHLAANAQVLAEDPGLIKWLDYLYYGELTEAPTVAAEQIVLSALTALHTAEIEIWEPDLFLTALQGANSFADCFFLQVWRPQQPLLRVVDPYTTSDGHPYCRTYREWDENAKRMWMPKDAELVCTVATHTGEDFFTFFYFYQSVSEGKFYVRHQFNQVGRKVKGCIYHVALAEFTRLPITEVEKQHLNPKHTKRMIRQNEVVPEIHRVLLRRSYQDSESSSKPGTGENYSCQWLVRGHWRNQFHPSTQERKPKFISPYVKGPEDKPLRVAQTTVREVRR